MPFKIPDTFREGVWVFPADRPDLYLLLTEGGADRAGIFHRLPRLDDARLAEIFAKEVLAFLVRKELLSPEWAERILSWRHTGFTSTAGCGPGRRPRLVPSKGWAEMIRKVYEVDPMICPRCRGRVKVVAFLTEFAVVDRIIGHLTLTFVAEKPPPTHVFAQVALIAAEKSGEYEWRVRMREGEDEGGGDCPGSGGLRPS